MVFRWLLRQRQLLLLLGRLTLLVIAAVTVMVILAGPLQRDALRVNEQRRLLAIIDARDEESLGLRLDQPVAAAALPKLRSAIPSADDLPVFLSGVESVAASIGITASFNLGLAELPPGTSAIPFSVSARGTLDALLDYLQRLEALPHIIRISSLDVVGADGISGTSALTVSGQVSVRTNP